MERRYEDLAMKSCLASAAAAAGLLRSLAQHVVVLSFQSKGTVNGRKSEAVLFIEITERVNLAVHSKQVKEKTAMQ